MSHTQVINHSVTNLRVAFWGLQDPSFSPIKNNTKVNEFSFNRNLKKYSYKIRWLVKIVINTLSSIN